MTERIRFHLDEHIDPVIALALRKRGVDVTTTNEAGLRTQDDAAQWAYVVREQRVIVTRDPDFLRFHDEGREHWGIAFCLKSPSIGDIIRYLLLIYDALSPEDMGGKVERIKPL